MNTEYKKSLKSLKSEIIIVSFITMYSSSHSGTVGLAAWCLWSGYLTILWSTMEFCVDIYGTQRMKATNISDPLTFPLETKWCYTCDFSEKSSQLLDLLPCDWV